MDELASGQAPESFHSVTLSVSGRAYTANIWRGGATQWRLLSVRVGGAIQVEVRVPPFNSCRAALEEAEKIAIKAVAEETRRHQAS